MVTTEMGDSLTSRAKVGRGRMTAAPRRRPEMLAWMLAWVVAAFAGTGSLAGCHGTVVTLDAYPANRTPLVDYAYCYVVGAGGQRRHGARYEWSVTPLPQTVGLRADGQATAVMRIDELFHGLPLTSASTSLDLSVPTATLALDGCQMMGRNGAPLSLRKQANVASSAKLAMVRSGAEAAGAAELVALGTSNSWRASLSRADLDDTGTALALLPIESPARTVTQVLAHDIDADCADDLIVLDASGTPEVWPTAAEGSPVSALGRTASTSAVASAMALGDLDGDGYADLATVTDEGLVVVRSDHEGRYPTELRDIVDTQVPMPAKALALGRIDRDPFLDVLVAVGGGPLYFLAGAASGKLTVQTTPVSQTLDASAIVLHDLDGDGDLDVVVASHVTAPGVRLLMNDGLRSGTNELIDRSSTLVPTDVPDDVTGLVFADLDHDCRDELIVYGPTGPPAVYDVGASGALSLRQTLGIVPAQALVAGDLDGDGFVEIAFVGMTNQVYVWSRSS